ncbi:MAG: hypothetical protein QGI83_08895 [Candidatus Latescibacteria bacterium]|jgi:hypothetical protein|nr:hypothetical protein [Candidatus Latescibacterota bacterium]
MELVETDGKSGAKVYRLVDDPRPADNIYGEQPYSSEQGNRVAIRLYAEGEADGGLSLLDLEDASLHTVLDKSPRFPAFHGWSEYLYYQEEVDGKLLLKRCDYQTLEKETVLELPTDEGRLSYGTVSRDHRFYAVSMHRDDGSSFVRAIDLASGESRCLVDSTERYFKHEQFSSDGSNRLLIQANSTDVKQVGLGVLHPEAEGLEWLAADHPHTPRPTGHEAWVGDTDRVFFSTGVGDEGQSNVWTAGVGDAHPASVCDTPMRFGHVSVSSCGRFWIGDATGEGEIPIYLGSFETGRCLSLVKSRTKHDGQQWSHTHPYLTVDSRWLIFTSNQAGHPQVYGARVPEAFLDSL